MYVFVLAVYVIANLPVFVSVAQMMSGNVLDKLHIVS